MFQTADDMAAFGSAFYRILPVEEGRTISEYQFYQFYRYLLTLIYLSAFLLLIITTRSNWEIAALYILDCHLEDFVCRMAILSLTTKLI